MPYKHPVLGVTCMSLPEFLNEEGKREGKTGGEVLSDIMGVMGDDDRKQEQYWKDHPEELLKTLKQEAQYEFEATSEPTPFPISIVSIEEVHQHSSFRNSSFKIVAIVNCQDRLPNGCFGKWHKLRVTATHSYWSGTMMQPPEEDSEFAWEEVK